MAKDDEQNSLDNAQDDAEAPAEDRRINPADRRATERVGVSIDRRKRPPQQDSDDG